MITFANDRAKDCFEDAKKFAAENNLSEQLQSQIDILDNMNSVIYSDFAPHSFCYHATSCGIFGGCIFHGLHGEITNGSVQLEPHAGWSLHS